MLESLRDCRVSKLFVFKDGPRPNNQDDVCASLEIERLIGSIDWDCDVVTNYMQNNLGCGYGPYSAISWAFQFVDDLIILEDDCLPTQSFFSFCHEMLEKYRDDTKVSLISGFSRLTEPSLFKGYDYIFSQYGVTWGWATWKRTWADFDMQLRNLESFFEKGGFTNQFRTSKESAFFNYRYKLCKNDTSLYKHVWDIQFGLHSRYKGALRIVPSKSLIKYIGIEGTHYSEDNQHSDVFDVFSHDSFSAVNCPPVVEESNEYDQEYFNRYVYTEYRFFYKVMNRIKSIIKRNR